MRTLAIVLLVVALAWTFRGKVEMLEGPPPLGQDTVPASAIQAILKEVVKQKPNLYPLDTVFIRPEGSTISSRFLFMDRTAILVSSMMSRLSFWVTSKSE